VFQFDRRSTGRLRRLIDRINEITPSHDAAARAAAHQIVPAELTEAAEREEAD
jgi:hypothetical protein